MAGVFIRALGGQFTRLTVRVAGGNGFFRGSTLKQIPLGHGWSVNEIRFPTGKSILRAKSRMALEKPVRPRAGQGKPCRKEARPRRPRCRYRMISWPVLSTVSGVGVDDLAALFLRLLRNDADAARLGTRMEDARMDFPANSTGVGGRKRQ